MDDGQCQSNGKKRRKRRKEGKSIFHHNFCSARPLFHFSPFFSIFLQVVHPVLNCTNPIRPATGGVVDPQKILFIILEPLLREYTGIGT
jgi:hypothetical protein